MNKNVYYESKRNFITNDINIFMSTMWNEKMIIKINKIKMILLNGGKPAIEIDFNIMDGKYKNLHVNIKQIIINGFQICNVNNFLRKLTCNINNLLTPIEFTSYGIYDLLIRDINQKTKDKEICLITKQINRKG